MKTIFFFILSLSFVFIMIGGCKKDQSINYPIKVGAKYNGGIIAYILQPNDPGYDPLEVHGLIVAPTDQSEGIKWDDHPTLMKTLANATIYGSGKVNTEKIVQLLGAGNYAAKLCADLKLNGFDDWYLPSKDELDRIYAAKDLIGGFSADVFYWTSSESTINNDWVWRGYFGENAIAFAEYEKNIEFRVRAIRYF